VIALTEPSVVDLSPLDLFLISLCVIVNAALSLRFRLGLEKSLLVASVRTVVQLLAIGYVLHHVFAVGEPLLVLAILLVMTALAGQAASGRLRRRFRGAWMVATGSILLAAFLMTAYAVFLVVQPPRWSDPRYLIPLMGMVLGNSLTAISLAMDRFTNAMVEHRGEIEGMLCLGASPSEAVHPYTQDAIRNGMTPMLQSMAVVGLVSLPGMMTGQILGGSPPELAVRYQILIMFLLAGSTALGSGACVLWLRHRLLDARGRLRGLR
jgi:putative ABC transport system permease protein